VVAEAVYELVVTEPAVQLRVDVEFFDHVVGVGDLAAEQLPELTCAHWQLMPAADASVPELQRRVTAVLCVRKDVEHVRAVADRHAMLDEGANTRALGPPRPDGIRDDPRRAAGGGGVPDQVQHGPLNGGACEPADAADVSGWQVT
jgi:hypothetical protein